MKKRTDLIKTFHKNSFTLIELLIVTSILAVTSLAIYSVFSSGLKIWHVASKQIPEEELGFFFAKFTFDLRNSFKSESLIFVGKTDRVEFATLVDSQRMRLKSMGRVAYSYDYQAGAVERETSDFSHIFSNDSGRVQKLIGNIKSFKLRYYFYDDTTKEYGWKDQWLEDEKMLPLAVRIELLLDSGGAMERFVKTVNIPAGG